MVVAVVFAALAVLYHILSSALLPITTLASAYSDRLPKDVAVGRSAGPFLWGVAIVQWGLGLVAVAFLVYVF